MIPALCSGSRNGAEKTCIHPASTTSSGLSSMASTFSASAASYARRASATFSGSVSPLRRKPPPMRLTYSQGMPFRGQLVLVRWGRGRGW